MLSWNNLFQKHAYLVQSVHSILMNRPTSKQCRPTKTNVKAIRNVKMLRTIHFFTYQKTTYCMKNAIYLGEQLLTLVNAFLKMVPFFANASVLGLLILPFPYTPSCVPASSAGIRIQLLIWIIRMSYLIL